LVVLSSYQEVAVMLYTGKWVVVCQEAPLAQVMHEDLPPGWVQEGHPGFFSSLLNTQIRPSERCHVVHHLCYLATMTNLKLEMVTHWKEQWVAKHQL
jgi:hypothetical protein